MTLRVKSFELAERLLKFVNDNKLQKDDIQAITHTVGMNYVSYCIFYWTQD